MNEKKPGSTLQELFYEIIQKLASYEKKIYIYLIALVLLIIILAGFNIISVKKIIAFMLFVFVGGIFKFMITRYKIWVEFTPIMFFCVIIGKYMGMIWVLIYILIADIMVSFLAGQGPTGGSVPYWLWMFIIPLIGMPFDLTGSFALLLPIIYFIGCLIVEMMLKGGLNAWRWGSAIANLVINLYFFVKLSDFFIGVVA